MTSGVFRDFSKKGVRASDFTPLYPPLAPQPARTQGIDYHLTT